MMDFMSEARSNWNSDAPASPGPSWRIPPILVAAVIIALPLGFIGWQLAKGSNPPPVEKSTSQITDELRAARGLKPL